MHYQKASDKRFVCLDDITGFPCLMNVVIYNPFLPKERNEEILKKYAKDYLRLNLTTDQVDELTSYDRYQLDEFIEHLRSIYVHDLKNKKT